MKVAVPTLMCYQKLSSIMIAILGRSRHLLNLVFNVLSFDNTSNVSAIFLVGKIWFLEVSFFSKGIGYL